MAPSQRHTDALTLQLQGIPQEFQTASRMAIIANQWKTLNRNVAALQDRGHVVLFAPSPLEVHLHVATWFWDALWHHRHQPVVLDDLDGLYASRDGVRLLKCLTQSEPEKRVSWHTDAPTLARDGIPRQFTTTSRVVIITNAWKTLNRDVAALQDRGHVILFQPSAVAIHLRTAEWFWDQEIFDFLGERLHWLAEASMRHYVAAWELKQAGLDWRSLVLSRCLKGRALLVAQVKADPGYGSEAERLKAFQAQGGGSRSTYFKLARRLQPAVPAAAIKLNNPPPARRAADETLQKILRRWNGHLGQN
jgi:hypothetical protein